MDFCGEYNEKEKNWREIAAVPRIGLTGRRHSVEYVVNWERQNEKEQLNIYYDIKKEMLTILGKPFSSNIYNGALLNEDTHWH